MNCRPKNARSAGQNSANDTKSIAVSGSTISAIGGQTTPPLCARLRRGTLLRMAAENGAQKLALGHHRDDVMETWLMSALNEGRFNRLPPIAPMARAGISVIRPLWNAREEAVADLARRYELPVVKNPCPVDGHTRRAEIRAHLDALERAEPGAKEKLWAALKREQRE